MGKNHDEAVSKLTDAINRITTAGFVVDTTVVEVYYRAKGDGMRAKLKETYDQDFNRIGHDLVVDLGDDDEE